ncbi:MAG: hypothetical protein WEB19_01840 [Acidimicrobiia bacterium]
MANMTQDLQGGHVPTVMLKCSGPVTGAERNYAQRVVADALEFVHINAAFVTIDLQYQTDGDWQRPALARASVKFNGYSVRAHADANTLRDAADVLGLRLRRQIEAVAARASDPLSVSPQFGTVWADIVR